MSEEKKIYFESNNESLTIVVPKINCPKHGEHDAYMTMQFYDMNCNKRWCMMCLAEKMEECGIYCEESKDE
jgi:hypothetical protein